MCVKRVRLHLQCMAKAGGDVAANAVLGCKYNETETGTGKRLKADCGTRKSAHVIVGAARLVGTVCLRVIAVHRSVGQRR